MITPTLDNILDLLKKIGCEGKIIHLRQGWTRVYITTTAAPLFGGDSPPDSIPVQIGRVMFLNEVFQWVKWYRNPWGKLNYYDKFWFSWELLLKRGEPIEEGEWATLQKTASSLSEQDFSERLEKRKVTNAGRAMRGKKRKTTKIGPPNPAHFAMYLMEELQVPASSPSPRPSTPPQLICIKTVCCTEMRVIDGERVQCVLDENHTGVEKDIHKFEVKGRTHHTY